MKRNVDLTENQIFANYRTLKESIQHNINAIKQLFHDNALLSALRILPWQDRCLSVRPISIKNIRESIFTNHIIYSEGICQYCGGTCIPWKRGLCKNCDENLYTITADEVEISTSRVHIPWRKSGPVGNAIAVLRR